LSYGPSTRWLGNAAAGVRFPVGDPCAGITFAAASLCAPYVADTGDSTC